jgi:hypothetical protein
MEVYALSCSTGHIVNFDLAEQDNLPPLQEAAGRPPGRRPSGAGYLVRIDPPRACRPGGSCS